MTAARATLVVLVIGAAGLGLSCNRGENGARGGEPERQLVIATVAGDVGKVKQLLEAGADPNNGVTVDIVRAMLRAHANPDVAWGEAPSRRGGYTVLPVTPLLEALPYDVPDVARALFEAGLSPRRGQLALVLAVENRQAEMVHVLVEAGVDVNCQPSANTPLVAAVETRDVALMTYLEQHGAREKP